MSMSTWQIKQRFQANNNKRFNYDDIVQNNKQDSHLIYLHLYQMYFLSISQNTWKIFKDSEKPIRSTNFDLISAIESSLSRNVAESSNPSLRSAARLRTNPERPVISTAFSIAN